MTAERKGIEGFRLDVPDDYAIEQGRKAAKAIARGDSILAELEVGRALEVGRRQARERANSPKGAAYNRFWSEWLMRQPALASLVDREASARKLDAASWCARPENWPAVRDKLQHMSPIVRMKTTCASLRTLVVRERKQAEDLKLEKWRAERADIGEAGLKREKVAKARNMLAELAVDEIVLLLVEAEVDLEALAASITRHLEADSFDALDPAAVGRLLDPAEEAE